MESSHKQNPKSNANSSSNQAKGSSNKSPSEYSTVVGTTVASTKPGSGKSTKNSLGTSGSALPIAGSGSGGSSQRKAASSSSLGLNADFIKRSLIPMLHTSRNSNRDKDRDRVTSSSSKVGTQEERDRDKDKDRQQSISEPKSASKTGLRKPVKGGEEKNQHQQSSKASPTESQKNNHQPRASMRRSKSSADTSTTSSSPATLVNGTSTISPNSIASKSASPPAIPTPLPATPSLASTSRTVIIKNMNDSILIHELLDNIHFGPIECCRILRKRQTQKDTNQKIPFNICNLAFISPSVARSFVTKYLKPDDLAQLKHSLKDSELLEIFLYNLSAMPKDAISGKFISLDTIKPKVLQFINELNATRCIHVCLNATSEFPREDLIREFKLKSTPFGDFDDFCLVNADTINDERPIRAFDFRIHYTSIESAIRAYEYYSSRIAQNSGTITDSDLGKSAKATLVHFGVDRCDKSLVEVNSKIKESKGKKTLVSKVLGHNSLEMDDETLTDSDLSPIHLKDSSKAPQERESPPTSGSVSFSTIAQSMPKKQTKEKKTHDKAHHKEKKESTPAHHTDSTAQTETLNDDNLASSHSNIPCLQDTDIPKSFANSDADLDDVDIEDISTPTSNIELESSFSKLLIGRNGRNSSSSSLSNDPYISRISNHHGQAFDHPNGLNHFGNSFIQPFQPHFNTSRSRSFSASSERLNHHQQYQRSENSAVAAAAAAAHAAAAQAQAAALAAVAAASSSTTSQAQRHELAAIANSLNNSANLNFEAIAALADPNSSFGSADHQFGGGNRTVYLGKLHPRTTVEEIANNVRAGGLVESINFVREHGNCFIKFIDPAVALTFHANHQFSHRLIIHGTEVVVGWARNHSGPVPRTILNEVASGASRNVYVGVRYKDDEKNGGYQLELENDETMSRNGLTKKGKDPVVELPSAEELRYDFMKFGDMEQINYYHNGSCVFLNFLRIGDAIRVVKLFEAEDEAKISSIVNDYGQFYNKYKHFKISFGKDRCANPPKFYFKRDNQDSLLDNLFYPKAQKSGKEAYTKVFHPNNIPTSHGIKSSKDYITTSTPFKKSRRGTTSSSPTDDFNEDIINEEAAMVFGIIQSDKRREEELAREVERQNRLQKEEETTQDGTANYSPELDEKTSGSELKEAAEVSDEVNFFDEDDYDYSEGIRYVDALDVEKELEDTLEIDTIEELDEELDQSAHTDKILKETKNVEEEEEEEEDEEEDDDEEDDDDDDVSIIISSADSSMIHDKSHTNMNHMSSQANRPSFHHSVSNPTINGSGYYYNNDKKNDYHHNNGGYQRKGRYNQKHGNNKQFRRNYSFNSFDGYPKSISRNPSVTSLPGNFGMANVPASPFMNPQNLYYLASVAASNHGLRMGVPPMAASPYMQMPGYGYMAGMGYEGYGNNGVSGGESNGDHVKQHQYLEEEDPHETNASEDANSYAFKAYHQYDPNGYPMTPYGPYSYGYQPGVPSEGYGGAHGNPGSQVMMEYLAKVQHHQNPSVYPRMGSEEQPEDTYINFYEKFAGAGKDKPGSSPRTSSSNT